MKNNTIIFGSSDYPSEDGVKTDCRNAQISLKKRFIREVDGIH